MTRSTAIWWVRRDLRLFDNIALNAALQSAEQVVVLFILDPVLLNTSRASPRRNNYLLAALQSLDRDLQARGSYLVLRTGDPQDVLPAVMQASGASAVFAAADFTPYARRRDETIRRWLPLHLVGSPVVHPPDQVLKPGGGPYTVFTPYLRAWLTQPLPAWKDLVPAPRQIPTPPSIASDAFSTLPLTSFAGFPASEEAARAQLAAFTTGPQAPVYAYARQRDLLAIAGTSRLSPCFRFGLLSAREAAFHALEAARQASDPIARQGPETWLAELAWREFYTSILYHFPHSLRSSFHPVYNAIPWRDTGEDLQSWQQGRTGYPVVDAAMRELQDTGWMHNRARMITASFLVKNLLIDWRAGERWFMQHLLDGDPASNNGGWQWVAGSGASASPWFRVFNPVLQGQRFDPTGETIRRYLPELSKVPDRYIHTPWLMPPDIQSAASCCLGTDYPFPIVDLASSRQRALLAFAQARDSRSSAPQ